MLISDHVGFPPVNHFSPVIYQNVSIIRGKEKESTGCHCSTGAQYYLISTIITVIIIIIFSGSTAQRRLWPRSRGFLITYNDAPHSVGVLGTSDQPVVETST
jgi:hypothetical protein